MSERGLYLREMENQENQRERKHSLLTVRSESKEEFWVERLLCVLSVEVEIISRSTLVQKHLPTVSICSMYLICRETNKTQKAQLRERERERGFWLSAKTKNSQISFFYIIYCTQNLILFFSLGRQSSACALMGSLWTSQFVWSTCMQPINNSNCLLISS